VIICGERRLVPNPATLDALGINRNMIDNMGLDDAGLTAIPRGADIPDVDRDPAGFQAFKELYDQETGNQTPSILRQPCLIKTNLLRSHLLGKRGNQFKMLDMWIFLARY